MNQDVEQAARQVEAILTAVRCSRPRQRRRVEELLASFGAAAAEQPAGGKD